MAGGPFARPLGMGGRQPSLSMSMAERIRSVDSKSPAEMAVLAAEVQDNLQNLHDVEPEIREMLQRRQRAMAMQDAPPLPPAPELAEPVKSEPAVLRKCCCGCGAMLVCANSKDAAMSEVFTRQLSDPSPPPPVDGSAQRAYCAQLARRRPKQVEPKFEEDVESRRRIDFGHLHRMAKPREAPPPPPPHPSDEQPFRALPPPSFLRAVSKSPASRSPSGMGKKSFSAPSLPSLPRIEGNRGASTLAHAAAPLSLPSSVLDGGEESQLMELRCHALKAKRTHLVPTTYGMPSMPFPGEDLDERGHDRRRHINASQQKRYTEEHLCRRSKNSANQGNSLADLQARLDALRSENQDLPERFQDQSSITERRKKRPPRAKHSSMEIAADIS